MFRIESKAIRTVLRWQIVGTAIVTLLGALTLGLRGAISVALGGAIGIAAALAFDFAARRGRKTGMVDATRVVFNALRAEAIKISVMVLLVWLVFVVYKDVAKLPFIGAFIASMLVLSMAFFASDE